jgi:hypothetical protein
MEQCLNQFSWIQLLTEKCAFTEPGEFISCALLAYAGLSISLFILVSLLKVKNNSAGFIN